MGEQLDWPWQYNFPPFFTLQPHAETRAKQVQAWKTLILDYCKKCKLYSIDVREAGNLVLFNNSSINRKLEQDVILSLLLELQKTGHASFIDKSKHRWQIYWHTLDEWGSIIYDYIQSSGLQNSVLTLYELSQGDEVRNEEFFEMQQEVLIKVLQVLEETRKCELIWSDGDPGVKFF
ncbi:vacuolar protein-sorting-associated protein 25 [Anthonomus grandis grandis]|uniref:vacuolar protein-sorting-associated protein 25 n=1 Tax=Anthonomus grandis grandis TaxID=2921223 RepID=UPI0021669C57|nr:vacuolar protein-sorting-associated protein 25 [Anthonomus grandis grandis]